MGYNWRGWLLYFILHYEQLSKGAFQLLYFFLQLYDIFLQLYDIFLHFIQQKYFNVQKVKKSNIIFQKSIYKVERIYYNKYIN